MYTQLHSRFTGSRDAEAARAVISACVHCGFCNATCPTYLDGGDERDGPRGRIYLIRQLLETGTATQRTQLHLDRCLTCRNCETTCPSGVQYGELLDVGRTILESDLRRSPRDAVLRWCVKQIVPHRRRFAFVLALARAARPLLPRALQAKVPEKVAVAQTSPESLARTMLVVDGCAQSAATPATNAAARRVFARLGISLITAPQEQCCGALHYHMGDHDRGRDFMRANIDAWWPYVEAGAEAIISTASGCGVTIKDYGSLLADDEHYSEKARRVASLVRDVAEVIENEDFNALKLTDNATRYALHCPCTLQHGQQLGDRLEGLLSRLGLQLVSCSDSHLCCGSAGSYSILEPRISQRLRDRKLAALTGDTPDVILTANVGCQLHLAGGTEVPVRHWIEVLDYAAASHSYRSK